MTQAASRLKVKDQDGVTIVEFLDKNILDEFAIQQITDEMTRLVDVENRTQMIINLVNVEHLSSAALGTLITINNRIKSKDGKLRLVHISGQILEVFKITKLDQLFDIHESYDDGLKAFK